MLAEAALSRALATVQRERAACGGAVPVGSGRGQFGATGVIQPPTKIKDVPPVYPPILQGARREARVVLEAVIDRSGAVTCLHVLRGDPFFDQSAIDAVRQWRYTPTTLDGSPVEVVMTVTVTYSLR